MFQIAEVTKYLNSAQILLKTRKTYLETLHSFAIFKQMKPKLWHSKIFKSRLWTMRSE